jgi:hypothetical protein
MPIRKSSVGGVTPSGTTADRPANPSVGDQFYNGTLGTLEIYTADGWASANGSEFNVVANSTSSVIDLGSTYPSGSYTFSSALSDTTIDVYLFNDSNQQVGYSSTPSITASSGFSIVKILGAQDGDLITFTAKSTQTGARPTEDYTLPPYILSSTSKSLASQNDTITVTGGNFSETVEAYFVGENDYNEPAKSIVRTSSTQLIITRPDNMINDNDPHIIRLLNPNTTESVGSSTNKLTGISSGNDPVWITASELPTITSDQYNSAKVIALSASDEDSLNYTLESGQLPTGFTLNSSNGEISGTPTSDEGTKTFTIRATDPSGNFTEKEFSIYVGNPASGGSVSVVNGYAVHTFTSNGSLTVNKEIPEAQILMVAGGGGAGVDNAGGGGAGGLVFHPAKSLPVSNYAVVIGAGGPGDDTQALSQTNGINTTFDDLTAVGGGLGKTGNANSLNADGGSGGGGDGETGTGPGSATQPNQSGDSGLYGHGNNGGAPATNQGGGGGGAGADGFSGGYGTSDNGGPGGDGLNEVIIENVTYNFAQMFGTGSGEILSGEAWFAGGGGGGGVNDTTGVAAGGKGGGGFGKDAQNPGDSGTANTGGGGGASNRGGPAGSGGSGIVIIRYPI